VNSRRTLTGGLAPCRYKHNDSAEKKPCDAHYLP
jgi:hypothetical protein